MAIAALAIGAAAQASGSMGLNLFAVGNLALIDPVFVPGPLLIQPLLLGSRQSVTSMMTWQRRARSKSPGGDRNPKRAPIVIRAASGRQTK
jgi:hypothetical protein